MGIVCKPFEKDMTKWEAVIIGPDDTEWEGAILKLLIDFTNDYPANPPNVKFLTKMFHPNIYVNGEICLDILDNKWTPIMNAISIL